MRTSKNLSTQLVQSMSFHLIKKIKKEKKKKKYVLAETLWIRSSCSTHGKHFPSFTRSQTITHMIQAMSSRNMERKKEKYTNELKLASASVRFSLNYAWNSTALSTLCWSWTQSSLNLIFSTIEKNLGKEGKITILYSPKIIWKFEKENLNVSLYPRGKWLI